MSFHVDWNSADRFIPAVVYHDGSIERAAPCEGFWPARDTAKRLRRSYIEAFRPEHEPRAYVEPTTYALCLTHTRADALTTPLYRNAIQVSLDGVL